MGWYVSKQLVAGISCRISAQALLGTMSTVVIGIQSVPPREGGLLQDNTVGCDTRHTAATIHT